MISDRKLAQILWIMSPQYRMRYIVQMCIERERNDKFNLMKLLDPKYVGDSGYVSIESSCKSVNRYKKVVIYAAPSLELLLSSTKIQEKNCWQGRSFSITKN